MMNTMYKTTSYGGMEKRDLEKNYFTTEENARKYAKNDTWNTDYKFYKVTMTVTEKGEIKFTEEKI